MYKTCACCKKLCSDTAHNVVVCNLTGTVVLSNRADDCEQFEELPAVERLDDDVVRKAIERNAGIADAMPPHAQRKCGWCENAMRMMNGAGDVVYHCRHDDASGGWVKNINRIIVPEGKCIFKPLPINTDVWLIAETIRKMADNVADDVISDASFEEIDSET